jgi:hypothetical protein
MCIEVMKRYRHLDDRITHHVGIFPFLQEELSPLNKAIFHTAFTLRPVLSSIVGLIGSLVPQTIVKELVKASTKYEGHTLDTASMLAQGRLLSNCLYLGQTELRDLDVKVDLDGLRKIGGKVTLLFCPDDKWGPLQMYERLQQHVGYAVKIIWLGKEEGFDHAFVTDKRQCSRMVKHSISPFMGHRSNL